MTVGLGVLLCCVGGGEGASRLEDIARGAEVLHGLGPGISFGRVGSLEEREYRSACL